MCIVHNNTCNDNYRLGEDEIICKVHIKRQLHSPCQRFMVVFIRISILFDFLCSCHYSSSLMIFFSSCDAYFLLLATCVHSPLVCTSHRVSSMCCHIWKTFLIFSTHHNQCTSIISQHIAPNVPPSLADL